MTAAVTLYLLGALLAHSWNEEGKERGKIYGTQADVLWVIGWPIWILVLNAMLVYYEYERWRARG